MPPGNTPYPPQLMKLRSTYYDKIIIFILCYGFSRKFNPCNYRISAKLQHSRDHKLIKLTEVLYVFLLNSTQPAKIPKKKVTLGERVFGESAFKIQLLYTQKYTPPHCFFCNFAGWVVLTLTRNIRKNT